MRTQIFFAYSFMVLALNVLFTNEAKAVPSDPSMIVFTQPNGSTINIITMGDEKVKWAKTIDGYPIMFNSAGVYEYAMLNSSHDMVPSSITVHDVLNRTTDELLFLQSASKNISYSKSQIDLLKGIWNMNQKSVTTAFPTTGARKLLCILIGFTDQAFTKTQADFDNLFNQVGYTVGGSTGSVKDYYLENSYNQFNLTVTVAGPYTASNTKAYYGANTGGSGSDIRPRELVTEAVNLANPDINYADFDNNADGSVDGIYVIYAGYGEEAGGGANCIWAHAWSISTVILDGKTINKYSCSPELRSNTGTNITRIGVICHEFGHVLGSLDYYDTDYSTGGSYLGTGTWDVMANGCWNNSGATPAHHNAYTKAYIYNWVTPTLLTANSSITLNNAAENSNSFYRYNTTTANEYFLIENRQQVKFDASIPGHGMIVYHVDQSYISSASNYINAGSHQGIYPVCANATSNPPTDYGTINAGGCPFPGTGLKTFFSDASTPNSHSWLGASTNKSLLNITENTTAKTVSFNFFLIVPSCLPPTGVTASSVTSSTATISWTAASPAPSNGYQYEIRMSGSAGSGSTGLIKSGSTVAGDVDENISGLSPATAYNLYVRSDCGSGNYSDWTVSYIFSTTCVVVTNPFTEALETSTFPPVCWTIVTGASNWARTTAASGYGNGASSAIAKFYDISGTTPFDLITFQINTSSMNSPVLKFDYAYATFSGELDQLTIYCSTNGGSSYTLLTNLTGGATGSLNTYGGTGMTSASFVPTSGQWKTKYIALPAGTDMVKFTATSAYGNNLYVDNISVDDKCVWTGSASSDWSSGTNWIPSVPGSTNDVTIPSGVSNMPIINSDPASPAQCKNLTINTGAVLTIAAGKALTVYGSTTINGTFTIESNATGTGSFIDNGTISGTVTVKKYLLNGRYWYLGAPTSNATAAAFGTLSSVPNSGNRLFYWNPGTSSYSNVTNTGDAMPAMRGYSFKNFTSSPITAIFTGTLNTGSMGGTTNLTRTTGSFSGYNLVCNPYPSAIDWGNISSPTTGLTQTNLEPSVWYRTNSAFGTYNWQSGIGVNGGQQYIPAMQAFWVRVTAGNATGGLQISNSARVHNSHSFYKTSTEANIFRINVTDGINTDETAVGFWTDAQGNYEEFDSEKMFYTSEPVPQAYTLSTDSIANAINGQPLLSLNEDRIIPLGFSTSTAGTFTYSATNLNDFDPTISVFLEDVQMGILQDLRQVDSYSFTSGIANNATRFKLHFGNNITTSISPVPTNNNMIAYSVNGTIYVNVPESTNGKIELFDLVGNKISSIQAISGKDKFNVELSKGVYIVRMQNNSETKTQKVVIPK